MLPTGLPGLALLLLRAAVAVALLHLNRENLTGWIEAQRSNLFACLIRRLPTDRRHHERLAAERDLVRARRPGRRSSLSIASRLALVSPGAYSVDAYPVRPPRGGATTVLTRGRRTRPIVAPRPPPFVACAAKSRARRWLHANNFDKGNHMNLRYACRVSTSARSVETPIVFVVDADPSLREGLEGLLQRRRMAVSNRRLGRGISRASARHDPELSTRRR